MITIATINVNGIRAAFRREFATWIQQRQPDILLLQETRAPSELVEQLLTELDPAWHVAVHASLEKGRAGVAVAAKLPFTSLRFGLPHTDLTPESPRDSGRWIEADFATPAGKFTTVSTYFHSATNTPEMAHTLEAKYSHLDRVESRLTELVAHDHPVIIGGDLNIAHHNQDIANWKGNLKNAGFLPEERAYLTRWMSEQAGGGWTDLGRHHAGDGPGPYTWWTWRGQAFTNDRGWRIDYHLGNAAALAKSRSVVVDKSPTYEGRFSDHAPVVGEYNI